jgi:hypothetical protein
MRWLPFNLDDNMGAKRDAIGELVQNRCADLPSLHFPLLFPYGELSSHLAVQYQGGTTSHNNDRISCRHLPHTGSGSSPVGTHCSLVLQDRFLRVFHLNYRNAYA